MTPGSGAPCVVARHSPMAPFTSRMSALKVSSAPMPM